MDGADELHDITGRPVSANDVSDYLTPTASNEENEYMKISTLPETTITPITDKYIPAGNVDKVTKPEIDTAALKKVYIISCVLLILNVISFVTIGILTHTLMKRADDTEVKSDELQATIQKLQGNLTALTETGPESFKVLETKVLEIESRVEVTKADSNTKFLDHSTKITDLEQEKSFHTTLIQDHGVRITLLEINKVATIDNHQKLVARIFNLENNQTAALSRLSYLEDGLNCTWGPWSSFTPCTATCGAGIQYRDRHCNGTNLDFSDHWCSRKETDIQTCNVESCERVSAFDCKDILQNGIGTTDGVYSVILNGTRETIQVYCDMTSDGGGWTVFQKRFNGSVDFYKNFRDYANGFGSVSGEFWLGLKYIYQMTKGVTNELRLDIEKSTGQKAYAVYQAFSLAGPPNYNLSIGIYSGTAGDSDRGLSYNKGRAFTTYDRDVDKSSDNCGEQNHGGWWFTNCAYTNLNGEYVTPGTEHKTRGERGVTYRPFDGYKSLKSTEMKFRRKS